MANTDYSPERLVASTADSRRLRSLASWGRPSISVKAHLCPTISSNESGDPCSTGNETEASDAWLPMPDIVSCCTDLSGRCLRAGVLRTSVPSDPSLDGLDD